MERNTEFIMSEESKITFHAYIPKKATISADQTTAKDFQKKGIITLSSGMMRKR